jgi:hypothetical protein
MHSDHQVIHLAVLFPLDTQHFAASLCRPAAPPNSSGVEVYLRSVPKAAALALGLVLECPLDLVALIIGAQVFDLFFKLRRFLKVFSRLLDAELPGSFQSWSCCSLRSWNGDASGSSRLQIQRAGTDAGSSGLQNHSGII